MLEGKLDEVVEMILDGVTFRAMASHFGVPLTSLHRFLASDANYDQVQAALKLSSAQYANKAEEVLINAKSDGVEISRARELAQHYRWMASKRNPKAYGDKLDVTSDNKPLNAEPLKLIIVPPNDDAGE